MVSTRNLLLTATTIAVASAAVAPVNVYRSDMSESSFKSLPEATRADGYKHHQHPEAVKFEYYTAASADKDLHFMHHIKPVVMRFMDSEDTKYPLMEFIPHMMVARGDAEEVGCLFRNGTLNPHGPRGCGFHCANSRRYCDKAAFNPGAIHAHHNHGLHGDVYVKESARLTCIWDKYGSNKKEKNGVYRYFQYMDALKGTGCDKHYKQDCLEQVMQTVNFDYNMIEECTGNVGGFDEQNEVLEKIVMNESPVAMLPALVINGREEKSFEKYVEKHKGHNTDSVLAMVCNAMDDTKPKPPVCDFCMNYCPNKVGAEAFDMGTCLWELKCGDKNTDFDAYVKSFETPAAPEPNKEAATQAAMTGGEGYSSPSHSTTSSSSSTSYSQAASEGLGVVATILAVIMAAGFFALAIMAVRVWRTKMIIDRYVKEQQAMNDAQQNGGVLGHRDPTFFPDDSALDLDLEPALQYSDHISSHALANGANGRASPPHAASFLPQLT